MAQVSPALTRSLLVGTQRTYPSMTQGTDMASVSIMGNLMLTYLQPFPGRFRNLPTYPAIGGSVLYTGSMSFATYGPLMGLVTHLGARKSRRRPQ